MSGSSKQSTDTSKVSRRRLIQVGGASAIAGLAGCLGGGGGGGTDTPADDNNGSDGTTPTQTMSGGGKTITFLTSETAQSSKEVYNQAKETFNEETGHTIEFEYVSFSNKIERLTSMVRGGNAPELADGNTSTVGSMLLQDLLEPVPEARSNIESVLGEFGSAMTLQVDGEAMAVPWCHKMQNQTVRKDLVNEVGEEYKSSGVGWDEHVNWVEKIDKETDSTGIALVAGRTGKAHQDTLQYLWTNAVDVFAGSTSDPQVVIDKNGNKQRTVEVLNYMNDLWAHSQQTLGWTWGDTGEAFSSGTVADVNYSVGRMIGLSNSKGQSWSPDGIGFVEPPFKAHKDDGRELVTAPSQFGVISQSDNPDVGKRFLEHFFTYNDGQHLINFLHSVPFHLTPTIPGIFESERYRDNEVIQQRTDLLQKQKELTPVSGSPALTLDNSQFNPIAPPAYGEGTLGAMVARVVSQGMDPGTAVDRAAQELRSFKE